MKASEDAEAHMNKPTVTLRPAYAWDCPNCGKRNFGEPIALEIGIPPQPANEAIKDVIPIDQFLCVPDSVLCGDCLHEFKTESADEEESTDEEG